VLIETYQGRSPSGLYLATLLGATDEATSRYFILIVALLLDPAAVLLLLAASHRRASRWPAPSTTT
jgi:hypothetical protein